MPGQKWPARDTPENHVATDKPTFSKPTHIPASPPLWEACIQQLDVLLTQRRDARVDTLQNAIIWTWADSTIATYRQRLRAIGTFAGAIHEDELSSDVVEKFLVKQLATACAPATIRTTISAVTMLHTLGIVNWTIPQRWWKLSTSAARMQLHQPRIRQRVKLDDICLFSANVCGENR